MKARDTVQGLLIVMLLAAFVMPAGASDADRNVLRQRLEFHYVPNPNQDPPTSNVQLDNSAIANGTETGAFWSNRSLGRLHTLVRALLQSASSGGDDTLQYYAVQITEIRRKKVIVMLLDDVNHVLDQTDSNGRNIATRYYRAMLGTNNRVWPSAGPSTKNLSPCPSKPKWLPPIISEAAVPSSCSKLSRARI